jgi:molecular chaperone GrpE
MGDNDTSETQQSAPEPELDQEQAEVVDQQTEPVDPEVMEAELAKVKDQLLRTIAESENIRRRASRDVENAHKFAVEKLLNDLFPVLDSLEKAVETATQPTGAEAIAEGVELSLKMFVSTLEKSGVAQIDPLGEPFDPQHHEAMAMVPNPDAEPNSVMEVMQKGYLLNERLVRAAKVIVVKAADQ